MTTETKEQPQISPDQFCEMLGTDVPRARCMYCTYGHMLECHYPFTCDEAECDHYKQEMEEEFGMIVDVSSSTDSKNGWGFTRNSKKAHYFVNGMSLCHKWGFYRGDLEDFNDDSSDNCTACKKALQKIRAKEKLEQLKETKKIEF